MYFDRLGRSVKLIPARRVTSLVAVDTIAKCTRVEDGTLGDVISRAARAVRRDPRRNWKRNRFHRSDRDLEEVVPVHSRVQGATRDSVAPDGGP
jgi:hypothetical protein